MTTPSELRPHAIAITGLEDGVKRYKSERIPLAPTTTRVTVHCDRLLVDTQIVLYYFMHGIERSVVHGYRGTTTLKDQDLTVEGPFVVSVR